MKDRVLISYINKEEKIAWNCKHIGLKDTVSESCKREREVVCCRLKWDECKNSKLNLSNFAHVIVDQRDSQCTEAIN